MSDVNDTTNFQQVTENKWVVSWALTLLSKSNLLNKTSGEAAFTPLWWLAGRYYDESLFIIRHSWVASMRVVYETCMYCICTVSQTHSYYNQNVILIRNTIFREYI